jgi:Flp pilus assembly protein TadD
VPADDSSTCALFFRSRVAYFRQSVSKKRVEKRDKRIGTENLASSGSPATPQDSPPILPSSLLNALTAGRALWLSLGLIVVNLVVYASLAHHDFIRFDDPGYVTENPHVSSGLTRANVMWALTTGYFANWHPLTWMSHMLDVQLFGMNAGPHHLVNLLLHIVATVLLFGLLHWTTGSAGRSAFVAALFAVHPAHVESVAWVAERKDVLSAVFWMLTICAYVAYIQRPAKNRYVLMLVFYALGLMSKPMLVTLPFVLLLLDLWPLRRALIPADFKQLVVEKIPLFVLAAASSVVTFLVQRAAGAVQTVSGLGFDFRVANAVRSYGAYIGEMLWPANLGVFYPFPLTLPAGQILIAIMVLIATTVIVLMYRQQRYLIVGWLWFLGTLVPVIGLVQVGDQAMADRYTYIPYIGLFIMVAWGMTDLLSRWQNRAMGLTIAAAITVLVCVGAARSQVEYWMNSVSLWQHTVDVTTDNYRAENNLGFDLKQAGRLDEAIAHLEKSLQIRPTYSLARANLGVTLFEKGRNDEAMANLRKVLEVQPGDVLVRTYLGLALVRQGKLDEAISEYNKALGFAPEFAFAQSSLGTALLRIGKTEEGIKYLTESLKTNPEVAEAHNNLGVALASQGKTEDAAAHFSEAVRIKPDYADARRNLEIARQSNAQNK